MTDTQSPNPGFEARSRKSPPSRAPILHALELAGEDLHRWCHPLSNDELNSNPSGLPSVAFHLKHIARSIDRLLTYAEARQLRYPPTRSTQSRIRASSFGRIPLLRTRHRAGHRRHPCPDPRRLRPRSTPHRRQEALTHHSRWPPDPRRRPHPTPRRSSHHHRKTSRRQPLLNWCPSSC